MEVDILEKLKKKEETIWINPNLKKIAPRSEISGEKFYKVLAAQNRLMRFFPYIASAFPETASKKGLIESDILGVPDWEKWLKQQCGDLDKSEADEENVKVADQIKGQIFIKDDAHLPIAGSVKARGGIHEVLKHAEDLLLKEKMIKVTDDYSKIDSDEFREFLSKYTIQVGSTGNLGLSIGIMSAKLGFKVIVHMSSDAKEWKKNMLREKGVQVIEYDGDYSTAVAEGRRLSDLDEFSYFVDDENSEDLFMGYATAALRLRMQLYNAQIPIDKEHPLFIYIPCGVGGAPGGITFGMKQVFGNLAHCFFVEPVDMPCFTLSMATGKGNDISVNDIGLGGLTVADGLAVGRASGYSCKMMNDILSGCVTVADEELLKYQKTLYDMEDLFLEPSALAGACGLVRLHQSEKFKQYLESKKLTNYMDGAVHMIWATGGGLVPEECRWEIKK